MQIEILYFKSIPEYVDIANGIAQPIKSLEFFLSLCLVPQNEMALTDKLPPFVATVSDIAL